MFILLYPYPYQVWTIIIVLALLLIPGIPLYFLGKYILGKVKPSLKGILVKIFRFIGILAIALFITEGVISLITIHHGNKYLGFRYATPETPRGELFILTSLSPGGIMEEAGFMKGDQFCYNSVNDLYILLIESQGKEVSVCVLRNGQEESIKVKVPEMRLPLLKVSFLI